MDEKIREEKTALSVNNADDAALLAVLGMVLPNEKDSIAGGQVWNVF